MPRREERNFGTGAPAVPPRNTAFPGVILLAVYIVLTRRRRVVFPRGEEFLVASGVGSGAGRKKWGNPDFCIFSS